MQSLKELSYRNLPPKFKVLLGTIDITDKVESIEDLNKSLDYVRVGSIRVGEVTVVVIDPDGEFSKDNPSNFFVENSLTSDGQGVSVQVDIGYTTETGDVLETAFVGNIIQMTRRGREGTVVIEATDELHKLYTEKLTDFGIEKTFQMESPEVSSDSEETEENRNRQRVDQHGFYPVPEFLLPISDGSTTLKRTSSDTLTEVPKVKSKGIPDNSNYEVDRRGIKMEGDFLTAGSGYPRLTMKAPYAYREISDLLGKILGEVDIHDRQIVIPDVEIGENFSSEGRVGYETVGTDALDANVPASWYGFTTDVFKDSNGDVYYLINSPIQDRVNRSRILKKSAAGVWSTIFVAAVARTEFWKIAKHDDYLFVMATNTDVLNALPVIQDFVGTPTFPKSDSVKVELQIKGSPTKVEVTEGLKGTNIAWSPSYSRGVLTLDGTFGDVEVAGQKLKVVAENVNGVAERELTYDIGDNDSWSDITVTQTDDIPPDLLKITPEAGSYDASHNSNGNYIFAIDVTDANPSVGLVVPTSADLKPQISHFLQMGNTIGNETFTNHFPDTRRSMVWHNNRLYYGYVNRNVNPVQFGVAKVGYTSGGATAITAVYAANSNGVNDAGFDFYISGSQMVFTYIREGRLVTIRTSA